MALFRASKDAAVASIEGESAVECMKVGQLLVDGGQLAADQLGPALANAAGDLLAFAESMVSRGVGRVELTQALAEATGLQPIDTKNLEVPEHLRAVLPEVLVRMHCAVAIGEEGDALQVLITDAAPSRRTAIEQAAGRRVEYRLADPSTVHTFIDSLYRADADISRLVASLETADDQARIAAIAAEVAVDDQAPVIQLVNRIVSQALRDRTSDIHIEPLDNSLRVRFRIDGHLVEAFSLPQGVHAALTSRLKIMSGMNIVEKRRPQDGQFSTVVDGKEDRKSTRLNSSH